MKHFQIYMCKTPAGWITCTGGKRKNAENMACHETAKAAKACGETRLAFVFEVPPFARIKHAGPKGAGRYPVNLPRAMAVGVRCFAINAEGKVAYKYTLTVQRTLTLFGSHFSRDSFTYSDCACIERTAALLP